MVFVLNASSHCSLVFLYNLSLSGQGPERKVGKMRGDGEEEAKGGKRTEGGWEGKVRENAGGRHLTQPQKHFPGLCFRIRSLTFFDNIFNIDYT